MIVAIYGSLPKSIKKVKRELFKKLLNGKEVTVFIEPKNFEKFLHKKLMQSKELEVLVVKDTIFEKRIIRYEVDS